MARCHCGETCKRCIICGYGIPGAPIITDLARLKDLRQKWAAWEYARRRDE